MTSSIRKLWSHLPHQFKSIQVGPLPFFLNFGPQWAELSWTLLGYNSSRPERSHSSENQTTAPSVSQRQFLEGQKKKFRLNLIAAVWKKPGSLHHGVISIHHAGKTSKLVWRRNSVLCEVLRILKTEHRNSATKDPWSLTGNLPSRNLLILAHFLWISPSNQFAVNLSCHCTSRSSAVLENPPFVVSIIRYFAILSILAITPTFEWLHHPLAVVEMG